MGERVEVKGLGFRVLRAWIWEGLGNYLGFRMWGLGCMMYSSRSRFYRFSTLANTHMPISGSEFRINIMVPSLRLEKPLG